MRTFLVVLVTLFALFLAIDRVEAQTGSGLDTLTQVNGWRLVEYAPGVTFAKTWFVNDPFHGKFSQFFEVDRNSPNVADVYKYYAVFKKILPKRIGITSPIPQIWIKYSHSTPKVNGYFEDVEFSIALGNKDRKTDFSGIGVPGDEWAPRIISSISLDSIDCVFIKISGGFRNTIVQADYFTFVQYLGGPALSVIEDFEDSTITDVKDEFAIPISYSLSQNYPNPFNPSTTITFQLSKSSFVTLKVFDVLGREVATLVNEEKSIGEHSIQFNASHLSSGMYVYQINIGHGQFVQTKKMMLMK